MVLLFSQGGRKGLITKSLKRIRIVIIIKTTTPELELEL